MAIVKLVAYPMSTYTSAQFRPHNKLCDHYSPNKLLTDNSPLSTSNPLKLQSLHSNIPHKPHLLCCNTLIATNARARTYRKRSSILNASRQRMAYYSVHCLDANERFNISPCHPDLFRLIFGAVKLDYSLLERSYVTQAWIVKVMEYEVRLGRVLCCVPDMSDLVGDESSDVRSVVGKLGRSEKCMHDVWNIKWLWDILQFWALWQCLNALAEILARYIVYFITDERCSKISLISISFRQWSCRIKRPSQRT